MKKIGLILIGMVAGIVSLLILIWGGQTNALANPPTGLSPAVVTGTPTPAGWEDEQTPAGIIASSPRLNVLATPVPGESLVYFVPSDSDATATVLYLYNTDTVAHIVALRGYSYNGVLVYSLNINIGAASFLRLSSDSIASAPPPSWATPAPIITNFTDFTYLASLSLPKGVNVEGYTMFNPGTGVVDPRADQGAIPLRFSSDPAALFMPLVKKSP